MAIKYARQKTALTGGGADAVDGIPYSSLNDGDFTFAMVNGVHYVYIYDASSSAAESVPDVIAPDDVGANTGRHILQALGTSISDSDNDTKFETERSADEDILRGKAGGQDVFYGYASGIFDLVKQSCVLVADNSGQTITDTTWQKVTFNTVEKDNQSEWSSVDNRITVTKGGIYLVRACLLTAEVDWSIDNLLELQLRINGSIHKELERIEIQNTITAYVFMKGSMIVPLLAGDYIELWTMIGRGIDTTLFINVQHNYFQIFKLG